MTIQVPGSWLGISAAGWLGLMLAWTVKGSLLLVVSLSLQNLLGRRSAALKSLVWLMVFAAVLMLPLVQNIQNSIRNSNPNSLQNGILNRTSSAGDHERSPLFRISVSGQTSRLGQEPLPSSTATTIRPRALLPGPVPALTIILTSGLSSARHRVQNHWGMLVLVVWLGGCCFCGGRLLHDLGAVWWVKRTARLLPDPGVVAEVARIQSELGLHHPVRVQLHDSVAVPFVTGWRRPMLILPASAQAWDPAARRATLIHELAHLKRRDLQTTLLLHLVCGLLWFNPLVWHCTRRAQLEMEKACDDCVIQHGTSVRTYASHLLRIATQLGRSKCRMVGVQALAERSPISERMIMILDKKIRRDPVRRGTGYLTALLITVICSSVAILPVVAQEAETAPGQGEPVRILDSNQQDPPDAWSLRVVDPDARDEIQVLLKELQASVATAHYDEVQRTEIARRFLAKLRDQLGDKVHAIDMYQEADDSLFVMVQVSVDRVSVEDDDDVKIVLRITPDGEDSFSILLPAETVVQGESDAGKARPEGE